ncbi:MAG: hypothetical protein FWC42_11180 [Proteobacteria bacterium]|nr:hypothetical protein [Pseudomonadota bacterium]MCL2310805.1 hypothetical protein [Pseudomonadota bacterium]
MRYLMIAALILLGSAYVAPFAIAGKTAEKSFSVEVLKPDEPPIKGAQCYFGQQPKSGDILKGDWVSKMWMKIDGRLIEFTGKQSAEETVSQVEKKIWKQTFKASNATLRIDFVRTAEGDDTSAMEGTIKVRIGTKTKEFKVKGGCAA